jgi:hypothetical protein
MPFTKTDNVAMYGQADWSGWVKTVPGCTPQQAQRIAVADPAIRFFFYCREYMVLTNPAWPEPRSFQPGDSVFFTGEPWFGSAPQCDSYVKNGLAVAYIGSLGADSTSPLVAGQYVTAQGLNSVDVVSLFAANLNLSLSSDLIRLAPSVPVPTGGTLAVAHDYYVKVFQQSVAALQEKGIAVLLTFLNNWDAAGWSNFDPETAEGQTDAWNFALQLQQVVETYGFDGIDIDDEYAQPDKGIPASLAMVTSMIRQLMPDKILSKALWADSEYFGPTYKGIGLAETLTCGWQMSYGDSPQSDLPPYVEAGMAPEALSYGFQAGHGGDPGPAIEWLKSNGYAGFMVYDFENPDNQALMGQLVDDWCGPGNWNKTS